MGDKAKAFVLDCGCRFFGGHASVCEEHTFDRKQARKDAAKAATIIFIAAAFLGCILFGGCSVDAGGLEDTDASTMGGKVRGADSGNGGMGAGADVVDPVPQDAETMETDVGTSDDGGTGTMGDGVSPDASTHTCPKSPPINGCMLGPLAFPDGPVTCCVPVDWEGYRVHCPQPFPGCRWQIGTFDGWAGECCA